VDVIIGNPPFLGSRKMRPELGEEYCDALLKIYGNRIEGLPDLVCYWVEKANNQIKDGKTKRAGLLATQAIRGGANKQVLDHIKESGNIFFAYSDKEWILDGATVHVSMIGFDDGNDKAKELDGFPVEKINSDLTSDVNLSEGFTLAENQNLSFQGVVLRGQFNISREEAEKMLRLKDNPNGLPNSNVIKRRRTGEDVVSSSSDSLAIDFGINMPIDEAAKYSAPFEYLKKHVYPSRQKANQAVAREKWWIHWNPRTQMRMALSKLERYIATPRVAKHRIFVWLEGDILPDAQLVVFARDDDYFFGVLHSKAHELWARRLGTQLRDAISGFRYTSTTTFETFPFPWPPSKEPKKDPCVKAIAEAAKELVEQRDRWLNAESLNEAEKKKRTLTNLYNQRPTWLDLVHKRLDEVVFAAYGWKIDLSDEEILERLLALNLERVKNA
jgi:type II restriction/modification system DNA methylase subunit YeeA